MHHLQSAKKSLFRFEYLQDFNISSEKDNFDAYKKTGVFDHGMMKSWWNFLELKQKEGVVAQRVRLVRKPITKYTEYSLEIFKETIKYGDEIRILPEEKITSDLEKLKDFWLIDDSVVLDMKYSKIGEYLGFKVIDDMKPYLKAKKYLLENSISL